MSWTSTIKEPRILLCWICLEAMLLFRQKHNQAFALGTQTFLGPWELVLTIFMPFGIHFFLAISFWKVLIPLGIHALLISLSLKVTTFKGQNYLEWPNLRQYEQVLDVSCESLALGKKFLKCVSFTLPSYLRPSLSKNAL